jgi:hypothetical protein
LIRLPGRLLPSLAPLRLRLLPRAPESLHLIRLPGRRLRPSLAPLWWGWLLLVALPGAEA